MYHACVCSAVHPQLTYEDRLTEFTTSLYSCFNTTLAQYGNATQQPLLANAPGVQYAQLSKAVRNASDAAKQLTSTKTQTADADHVLDAMLKVCKDGVLCVLF